MGYLVWRKISGGATIGLNMRQSELFLKTQKEAPKDEVSKSAQLLLRAGFIDKLMAGSYTFLHLGFLVLTKIEQIIREEMNKTGAQEILMPLLHPKSIWEDTGRWESAKAVMFQLEKDGRQFGLSFTHEEVILDIVRKRNISYKDLPLKRYHFSSKFRNEPRPRSGLLRGIEFLMKDLYSLHADQEDAQKYYREITEAYLTSFKRMGLDAKVVEAGGGVFTKENTHEFQVLAEGGEDTIFYCEKCDWAQNKEIAKVKQDSECPKCGGKVKTSRAIEVGNIFPLGTWYSEKMGVFFKDEEGRDKPVWFASYGIGTSRLVGTLAEIYHDEKGLMWPESVAPFAVHLINLMDDDKAAQELYGKLVDAGAEVLYDDRADVSAGEKFADADLIGIPIRAVISEKNGEKIEIKKRAESKTKLMGLKEVIDYVGA